MPIVDVTYSAQVAEDQLRALADLLPHAVSVAVECPEEPYDGLLKPGDVEIRFHPRSPLDPAGLDVLVEVRSKWFASRVDTRQDRCDRLYEVVSEVAKARNVGVYLTFPVAAWAQAE